MSSRASRRNDTTDVIKKIQNDNKRNQGLSRQAYSGLASAEYGDNTSSSSGGSGTTSGTSGWTGNATTDLNMNTFDVISVDRLSFVKDSGVGTNANTPQIYISSAASDMVFNHDANDFTWKHTNVTSMTESTTTLKKESTISPSFVLYNSRTAAVGTAANIYFDAKETTTGNVSMGYITAETQDATVNGSGSLHLGVRESGAATNYIELNEADDNNIRIHRSLIMNTSTIFLDTDNDTYIESQTDDQLKIYSGGTNVINIKPTVVLVTQNIDMLGAKVTGLATPTATTDAANKAYVDSVGGGSTSFIGFTGDDILDMATYDIERVGQIEFNTTSHYIKSNSVGFEYRVPVGDTHEFFINGVSELLIESDGTTLGGDLDLATNDIQNVDQLNFEVTGQRLNSTTSSIQYEVPSGDSHKFLVSSTTEMTVAVGAVTVTNDLTVTDNTTLGTYGGGHETNVNGKIDFRENYSATNQTASDSDGYIDILVGGLAKKLYYY
tara:strand:+ start:2308 stop:3795 length:1488 start_codon:yes stop_codon:yes gene_type:complete